MRKVTTAALVWLTLAAAIALRLLDLARVPGINGDEAWYGVLVQRMAAGETGALWTPTGNPVNPFYAGPLLLLHLVLPPSVPLLRSVAAASGILALLVNYLLCRRIYGSRTAAISTLILAALPINIAYSRFGWDASQSLLATIPVVYLSLAAARQPSSSWIRLTAAAGALVAAVLVHPTNIFVAPFVLMGGARVLADRGAAPRLAAVSRRLWLIVALAVLVLAGVSLPQDLIAPLALRLVDPEQLLAFVQRFQRLFTGVTVYQFIPGTFAGPSLPPWDRIALAAHDAAGLAIFGVALAWLVARTRDGDDVRDWTLLVAWGLSVAGFYIVAGPRNISPHWERYGIGLIAPTAIVLARAAARWISSPARTGRIAVLLAAAWVALASFSWNYMLAFKSTGGRAHQTFRTGPAEPKAAALEYISQGRSGGEAEFIVTSTWWTYWPLAYLAADESIEVLWASDAWRNPALVAAVPAGRVWVVEFAGSAEAARGRAALRTAAESASISGSPSTIIDAVILDYAGRAVLSLSRIESARR